MKKLQLRHSRTHSTLGALSSANCGKNIVFISKSIGPWDLEYAGMQEGST